MSHEGNDAVIDAKRDAMETTLLSVTGSHGELMVNSITGEILQRGIGKCDCDECESNVSYPSIDKFDLTDVTVPIYWDSNGIGYIDIVRIGYWENNGEYVPPVIITNEGERE